MGWSRGKTHRPGETDQVSLNVLYCDLHLCHVLEDCVQATEVNAPSGMKQRLSKIAGRAFELYLSIFNY